MQLVSTKCCAVFEIDQLSVHPSAEEAMIAFCTQAIPKPLKFWDGAQGCTGELASFYMFTAGVSHDGTKVAGYHGHGGAKTLYGKEFMKLIQAEGLGEVWESPVRPNTAFHPGSSTQIYIWTPNKARLQAWFKKHDKTVDKPLKV